LARIATAATAARVSAAAAPTRTLATGIGAAVRFLHLFSLFVTVLHFVFSCLLLFRISRFANRLAAASDEKA
jgi:hypothetical protein